MARRGFKKHCSEYLQDAVRFWLGLADQDTRIARGQLELIVDCVCDRHGVPRTTAEREIYKGLLHLSLRPSPAAAKAQRESANT